tara:strand:- start:128 stop:346 length:219 start_codon:yes stop_codon:yes gene_type:complete
MKVLIFLTVTIILNILFWGWSESYIYHGDFTSGLIKGAIASAFFVALPFILLVVLPFASRFILNKTNIKESK